ncbi:MAG: hypothetical protein M0C28_45480 [Candidatus Moduliflexus flocculans]|nr:hypothetical protein [Candidatus Moduliflexus flocculans]
MEYASDIPRRPHRSSVGRTAGPVRSPAQAPAPEKTHPLTIHDMLAMDRISDPQVSPDGKWIVFTVRQTDLEANRGRTDLWLVGTDGKGLRRLTSHPAADFNAALVAVRPVGLLPLDALRLGAGLAHHASTAARPSRSPHLPLDVGSLVVSPDGGTLAVTMEVFPGSTPAEHEAEARRDREAGKATGRLYDQLFVRHWDTWSDGRRIHLFAVPIARDGEAARPDAGHGRRRARRSRSAAPEEFAFTPDGKGLVFTAKRRRPRGGLVHEPRPLLRARSTARPRRASLTDANQAWDTHARRSRPTARPWPTWPWPGPATRPTASASCCATWPDGEDARA